MIVSGRPNGPRGSAAGLLILSLIAAGLLFVPAGPAAAVTYKITIHADKASYSGNQTIAVSGVVSPAPGGNTGSVISIKNPTGIVVDIASVSVNASSGAFSHTAVAGGTANWMNGNYTVTVAWGGSGTQIGARTSFLYSTETVTSSTSSTTESTSSTGSSSTTHSSSTTSATSSSTSSTVPEFDSTSLLFVSIVVLSAVAFMARNRLTAGGKRP